jgi:hypothetical protein
VVTFHTLSTNRTPQAVEKVHSVRNLVDIALVIRTQRPRHSTVTSQPNIEGAAVNLPPVPVSGDPETTPRAAQRDHDLGCLYEAVRSAQNRAEMATWPDLARELRAIRARVWERICEGRP